MTGATGEERSPSVGRASTATTNSREERILEIIETARGKRGKFKDEHITMSHGAGGKATQSLIEGLMLPAFENDSLAALGDAGAVSAGDTRLAMTTDSFVVNPIRFPGGSIGELAVNGTVNDLAVSGARPLALSLALVLEEGLAADELRAEVEAAAVAAREAGRSDRDRRHQGGGARQRGQDVRLHHRRGTDRPARARWPPTRCGPGTGSSCPGRSASTARRSCWPATSSSWRPRSSRTRARSGRRWTPFSRSPGPSLRAMRDATRGGVASALNELARASRVAILVSESAVPVKPEVAGASELLGIDPMYVANEGRFVAIVAPDGADAALRALRSVPGCEEAAEIGEVRTEPPGMVLVDTAFGGRRVMDLLAGDPLPRIC